jgi:hypothetical protein
LQRPFRGKPDVGIALVVTEGVYDDDAFNGLLRAYIACQLAVESLPRLPEDVRAAVDEPIRRLCEVVGPELERPPGLPAPLTAAS